MAQETRLIKEQERYLLEHYSTQPNNVIADALTTIGERYNKALSEDMLSKAKMLTGMARVRAEKQARDIAVTKAVTDKTVMYYGSKLGLRKLPEHIGRPRNDAPPSDYITKEDTCTFFGGSYMDEVRESTLYSGRRFIYFNDYEPLSIDAMKSAVQRFNKGEGCQRNISVSAKYYLERSMIMLSVTVLA